MRGEQTLAADEAAKLGFERGFLGGVAELVDAKKKRCVSYVDVLDDLVFEIGHERYYCLAVTVILAGKRYNGVYCTPDFWWRHRDGAIEYCWTREQWEQWLNKRGVLLVGKNKWIDDYFATEGLPSGLRDRMAERRWTIMVNKHERWAHKEEPWLIDQPVLKSIQFYRRVPPNIAYQEIDMWVGGILPAAGRPMVEVSDEVRLAKHGMDEMSFQRPKQKARKMWR